MNTREVPRHPPTLSATDHQRHLSRAQLHTYARGEVDPARKAVIEAHLEGCEECQARLRQVQGVTGLLNDMGGKDFDELRWRRIRDQVRTQLEVEAGQPATADVTSGRRWVLPAIAAAAAVGLMVWGVSQRDADPRRDVEAISHSSDAGHESIDAQQLASGAAPLVVTLASGARLELEPRTSVRALRPHGPQIELALSEGALQVRLPAPPSVAEAPVIRTPAFRLIADSDDFSTGFWADRYFIDVRSGQVTVEGDDFEGPAVIGAGERHEVRAPEGRPNDTDAPAEPAPPRRTEPRSRARKPVRRVLSKSEPGAVTVEVVPASDPVVGVWREANEAYYRRRDLPEAVRLAERVVALGGTHAHQARQLLCDAQIALGDAKAALTACTAVLAGVRSEEERRNIHFTIGTIYRTLMADCRRAIEHYNQALVFGRHHILDDEVRVFRATCALEVGDIALAERDVASLSARAGRLARREEVTVLQRKLASVKRGTRAGSGETD